MLSAGPANVPIHSLTVHDSIVYTGTDGSGVFISADKGVKWTTANSGLLGYQIFFLSANDNTIYAGTYSSCSACIPAFSMFYSSNSGASWAIDTFFDEIWASSLAENDNNFFAGTYTRGVFLSKNNGAKWSAVNIGLTDTSIYSLTANNGIIFAGTYRSGVFLSTDNAATWSAFNSGLPDTVIYFLSANNNTLFAAAEGRGLWMRSLSEMSAKMNRKLNDNNNAQMQFYRRDKEVIMEFRNFNNSHVSIEIFDLAGRKIGAIVENYLKSGFCKYILHSNFADCHNYIVRLKTESGTVSKVIQLSN